MNIRRYITLLLASLLLLPLPARADNGNRLEGLLSRYEALLPRLENNAFGVPIVIEANGESGRMEGNVYGIIDQPFELASQHLTQAKNWCEITPLHFNVKVCTWERLNGDYRLTIYSGRKFYEEPGATYVFSYRYHNSCDPSGYCQVKLTAEDGPIDTGNYLFRVELVPLDGKTFLHFHYSYDYGIFTSTAMVGYFATLGSGKVGFTVIDKDEEGENVYVGGLQGVMERNAMRYYLALQTYLETLRLPEDERFEMRLERWYDQTDKYRRQLFEMSRDDYLAFKRREHADQLLLQEAIKN